jgi:acyl-CoA thioesterase FadM
MCDKYQKNAPAERPDGPDGGISPAERPDGPDGGISPAETDHVYPVETEVGDLDANGLLKPHGYQKLFARIAEAHLNRLNLNVDATLPHNLAWALVTMSFELIRPVTGCTKLMATTWHSQRKGPWFRRELVFRDTSGEVAFHGSTFSVLLDMTTRGVYRRRETPFPIAAPHEVFVMEAGPGITFQGTYAAHEERKVRNSHIDALGHVNNIRYGEFALDALTQEECARLGDLRRMDIRFVAELRPQDRFVVERAVLENQVGIRGVSQDGETTHFEYILTFAPR